MTERGERHPGRRPASRPERLRSLPSRNHPSAPTTGTATTITVQMIFTRRECPARCQIDFSAPPASTAQRSPTIVNVSKPAIGPLTRS